jgi:hypothetical protein
MWTGLRLAQLHSQAVDYNKSGVPAIIPRDLRPRHWPHFMEKWRKPKEQQYHSDKILGQLYDIVERVKFVPEYESPFDERILCAFELEAELLDKVENLKEEYDANIKRIMAQHDIGSEFEVWSTFVMSHNDTKRDYSFAEELGKTIAAVKGQYRKLCVERAGGEDHLPRFVAAMYTVTARQIKIAVEECRQIRPVDGEEARPRTMDPSDMPLMSFPWIFGTELGKIARGRTHTRASVMQQHDTQNHKQQKRQMPPLDAVDTVATEEGIIPVGEIISFFDRPSDEPDPGANTSKSPSLKMSVSLEQKAIQETSEAGTTEQARQRNNINDSTSVPDKVEAAPCIPKNVDSAFSETYNSLEKNGAHRTVNEKPTQSTDKAPMRSFPEFSSDTAMETVPIAEAPNTLTMVDTGLSNSMVSSNLPLRLSDGLGLNIVEQDAVEEITIDFDIDDTPSALDKLYNLVGGEISADDD